LVRSFVLINDNPQGKGNLAEKLTAVEGVHGKTPFYETGEFTTRSRVT